MLWGYQLYNLALYWILLLYYHRNNKNFLPKLPPLQDETENLVTPIYWYVYIILLQCLSFSVSVVTRLQAGELQLKFLVEALNFPSLLPCSHRLSDPQPPIQLVPQWSLSVRKVIVWCEGDNLLSSSAKAMNT